MPQIKAIFVQLIIYNRCYICSRIPIFWGLWAFLSCYLILILFNLINIFRIILIFILGFTLFSSLTSNHYQLLIELRSKILKQCIYVKIIMSFIKKLNNFGYLQKIQDILVSAMHLYCAVNCHALIDCRIVSAPTN